MKPCDGIVDNGNTTTRAQESEDDGEPIDIGFEDDDSDDE